MNIGQVVFIALHYIIQLFFVHLILIDAEIMDFSNTAVLTTSHVKGLFECH